MEKHIYYGPPRLPPKRGMDGKMYYNHKGDVLLMRHHLPPLRKEDVDKYAKEGYNMTWPH